MANLPFGIQVSRRQRVERQPDGTEQPTSGEAGRDGESWYLEVMGGGPDVNPELTGSAKFREFDEMRQTDAAIKSLLWYFTLTMRSATWLLEPAAENPVDRGIADYCAANLGLNDHEGMLDLTWGENLAQAGHMLAMGAMLEELVWDDIVEWRDADGETHLTRPLARLAPRMPATIQKVEMDKRGRISEVTQNVAGTSPIPGSKVTHLVFERNPGTWEGLAMIRPCWGAWRLKKGLMVAAGIGWDRWSSGIPEVRYPNPGDKETAEEMGREVRAHERAYLAFENNIPEEQGGWAFKIHSGAHTLPDPVPLLRQFDYEIAMAGLQQFTVLGLTASGSRAVGDVQVAPFYLAVGALADYVRLARTRDVIRRIVDVNFGKRYDTPRLTVSNIRSYDLAIMAQAAGDLASVGVHFGDVEGQNWWRERLGAPQLLEAELEGQGVPREQIQAILEGAGLTPEALAAIVAQLPEDVGLVQNRDERGEGEGLAA